MLLDDEIKRKILSLVEGGMSTFTEVKKVMRIESNQLSYHLNILVKDSLLSKTKEGYILTQKGKTFMPYLRYSYEHDLLPMTSVGVFITKGNKVLLLKRKWEPFKDYYLGISGKLKRYENVFGAAEKRVMELIGIKMNKLELFCINNFVSKSHHFVMFFFRATTKDYPKQGEWVDINKLGNNVFPETKYILKNFINSKKIVYINSYYDDQTGKFKILSKE